MTRSLLSLFPFLALLACSSITACSSTDDPAAGAAGAGGGGAAGAGAGGAGAAGDGGAGGVAAWQTIFEKDTLKRALLSVWGTSPTDVYSVGGPLGSPGFEALALHFDGTTWRDMSAGGTASFWWVSGTGPQDVWMVGEKGRITHWDGKAFREDVSGVTVTLFGLWASSPTDAWAVGGTPGAGKGAPNDVVLHWDGKAWSPETLPAQLGAALFKVWGSGPDDVYVVGEGATVWHRKGGAWKQEQAATAKGTLLTVSGCSPSEVYAVGENNVVRSDGTAWTALTPKLTSRVNGVACNAPGQIVLVGSGGLKQRLVDGAWIDEFTKPPYADLHGAWADGQGSFWAAGGDFAGPASGQPREGVLARWGKGTIPTTLTK